MEFTIPGLALKINWYMMESMWLMYCQTGRIPLELGGNFSFVSPVSSEDFYINGHFNTLLKLFAGLAYDLTENHCRTKSCFKSRLITTNVDKFGIFFSITPIVYVRSDFSPSEQQSAWNWRSSSEWKHFQFFTQVERLVTASSGGGHERVSYCEGAWRWCS